MCASAQIYESIQVSQHAIFPNVKTLLINFSNNIFFFTWSQNEHNFCIMFFLFIPERLAVCLDDCICFFSDTSLFCFVLWTFPIYIDIKRRRSVCEMCIFMCNYKNASILNISSAFQSIPTFRFEHESSTCERDRDALQWVGFTSRHMFFDASATCTGSCDDLLKRQTFLSLKMLNCSEKEAMNLHV